MLTLVITVKCHIVCVLPREMSNRKSHSVLQMLFEVEKHKHNLKYLGGKKNMSCSPKLL